MNEDRLEHEAAKLRKAAKRAKTTNDDDDAVDADDDEDEDEDEDEDDDDDDRYIHTFMRGKEWKFPQLADDEY
jgi:hypothetical protein